MRSAIALLFMLCGAYAPVAAQVSIGITAPAAASLPTLQRQYSGDRYPRFDHQQALRNQLMIARPVLPVRARSAA